VGAYWGHRLPGRDTPRGVWTLANPILAVAISYLLTKEYEKASRRCFTSRSARGDRGSHIHRSAWKATAWKEESGPVLTFPPRRPREDAESGVERRTCSLIISASIKTGQGSIPSPREAG